MAGQIADCNIGEAWQVCSLGLVFLYDFVFHPRFKVMKPLNKALEKCQQSDCNIGEAWKVCSQRGGAPLVGIVCSIPDLVQPIERIAQAAMDDYKAAQFS